MTKIPDPRAAQMALLAMYAEDMYRIPVLGDNNLTPPVDSRVSANWNVVGFIAGRDAILDTQSMGLGDVVYYGFLGVSKTNPTEFVAVIRGTENFIEWIVDAEFLPVHHALKGRVEGGFYSIYRSMEFIDGAGVAKNLDEGIAPAIGQGTVTVVGHSLGSALATYLTIDLAVSQQMGSRVRACMFASPRPGDTEFVNYFDQQVASYTLYNYALDVVPTVPGLFGYTSLPRATRIAPSDAQSIIENTLPCNHHAICYAAMLDRTAADWTTMPPVDQQCAACIDGPKTPAA